ncbi:Maf/Ham1 [Hypoxylon fragiforme]|uniref:Maf/Ham1 n=1 Tax=Hypoxylon fragiforme TaxID=63214 RepID=UPI0020C6BFD2|nr:Maf/Ham1 [Hypoxylon fragiforme]KAI2603999.1 Maf/Ham1 [Hypoxylon fragiforme]
MDEKKPLLTQPTPSDPPPDYTTSALEHGQTSTLPIREKPPHQPTRSGRPPPPPGALLDLPILKYMRTNRVILASASPRRRALLAQLGLPNIEVRPSTKPEDLSKADLGPWEYVAATAQQKALDVYAALIEEAAAKQSEPLPPAPPSHSDDTAPELRAAVDLNEARRRKDPDLVIAADTVVVTRDGAVLEKPASEAAHVRMLRLLRDTRAHRVLTAVCCVAPRPDAQHPGYAIAAHVEETKVHFARERDGLPDDVIDSYVRTREGADKAGGYAVQGLGGILLVEKVDGSVDNVIGLPVRKCLQLCEKVVFRQDEVSDEEEDEVDE